MSAAAASPLGMKKQFPTIVHESAAAFDKIYISGGRIGTSITVNPDPCLPWCAASMPTSSGMSKFFFHLL